MRRAALLLSLLALSLGLAGCGGGEEVSPTPETVEGTLPEETTTEDDDRRRRRSRATPRTASEVFASAGCGGCHTLEAAGSSGNVGPNLDDSKPDVALVVDRVTNGQGAMPSFEDQLSEQEIADVAAYVVESTSRLNLPPDFPRDVAAFACDLDRTLIAEDGVLRPRTIAAIAAARAAGIPVLIATGRMFRSALPSRSAAGIEEPLVCYQGAAVVDPVSGEWLLHEPIPLELAREAIAAVAGRRASGSTATSTTSSTSPR